MTEFTEAKIPFSGDTVDLTNPMAVAALAVALILGFTLWNMADSVGSNLASRINSGIGALIGVNPATGEESNGERGVV